MNKIFRKFAILMTVCISEISIASAQNGLEKIIVERYYISNANDSVVSTENGAGNLPVGSVTYRIYLDMKEGYKFQMAYGSPTHPLIMNTTTSFYNNEDRGSTFPTYSKANAKFNTVMLDSWLTAGAACIGNFGILKTEDDGVSTVINADGALNNDDSNIGILLTEEDGLIAGNPGSVGALGIDTEIEVFDAISQAGNTFNVTNGAWYCLAGATGYDTSNIVLIAQITTDGIFSFELNIQMGTPEGGIEKYVAQNPENEEILFESLIFSSDIFTNSLEIRPELSESFAVFPNPSNGKISILSSDNLNNTPCTISVFDLCGKKMLERTYTSSVETLDISSLTNGTYLLKIQKGNQSSTKKIIKNSCF